VYILNIFSINNINKKKQTAFQNKQRFTSNLSSKRITQFYELPVFSPARLDKHKLIMFTQDVMSKEWPTVDTNINGKL